MRRQEGLRALARDRDEAPPRSGRPETQRMSDRNGFGQLRKSRMSDLFDSRHRSKRRLALIRGISRGQEAIFIAHPGFPTAIRGRDGACLWLPAWAGSARVTHPSLLAAIQGRRSAHRRLPARAGSVFGAHPRHRTVAERCQRRSSSVSGRGWRRSRRPSRHSRGSQQAKWPLIVGFRPRPEAFSVLIVASHGGRQAIWPLISGSSARLASSGGGASSSWWRAASAWGGRPEPLGGKGKPESRSERL